MRVGRRPALPCVLFAVGLAAMVAAWIALTPFGGSPDEIDHYLRAVSIGQGEWVGDTAGPEPARPEHPTCCEPGNASARAWAASGTRLVDVPPSLQPATLRCGDVMADPRGACDEPPTPDPEPTLMGTIEPLPYVPAAVLTRLAGDATAAFRLARAGTALVALALTALGIRALWRVAPRWPSLLGAALATSPAVAFLFASPSPNALEVAGTLCFLGGGLAVVATPVAASGDLATTSIGATVLAASRSVGPVWLVVLAFVVVLGADRGTLRAIVATRRRAMVAAALAPAAAVTATVAWELAVQPSVPLDLAFFLDQAWPSLSALGRVSRERVGVFGMIDVAMPWWCYLTWNLVTVLLVIGALRGAPGRHRRLAVAATPLLALVAHVVLAAGVMRQNGFDIQGRHLLPVLVAIPVVAGHHLASSSPAGGRCAVAIGGGVALAAVHVVGVGAAAASYETDPTGRQERAAAGAAWLAGLERHVGWSAVAIGLGAGAMVVAALLAARPSVTDADAPPS